MRHTFLTVLLYCFAIVAAAEEPTEAPLEKQAMNNQRLGVLIQGIADDVEGQPGYWRFSLHDYPATVITDEKADRMRIIVPIAEIKDVDSDRLIRLMQANFDSALDARYSIAKGILWSAYIHPLSELSEHQFIDGLAQAVNLAATYGTTYSSGALIFGGGDSQGEQNKYYKAIIERKDSI
jgi:hypothetical protein